MERRRRLPLSTVYAKLFLPDGYPHSVTPDYVYYQAYNSLQALCSSVAGLIASRAILEGAGVGDASASATNALHVTIIQDICSRLTTIIAAYYIGTSLFPEAKTYRFLADLLNDSAITLDTLSPLLNSVCFPSGWILLPAGSLRVLALCLSGALRSLCGMAAGGSKAALSAHFASSTGDLGDLNAKDSSRETVVTLLGMLVGASIVPYLTTRTATYTTLFFLLFVHVLANYLAVRTVVLPTLNRQRTMVLWRRYTRPWTDGRCKILSPTEVAAVERILEKPGVLRDGFDRIVGWCKVGSGIDAVGGMIPIEVLEMFEGERYVLWFNHRALEDGEKGVLVRRLWLHVMLKEGHGPRDHLRAWIHAVEVGMMWRERFPREAKLATIDGVMGVIRGAQAVVKERLEGFTSELWSRGWKEEGVYIVTGSTVLTGENILDGLGIVSEGKTDGAVWGDRK